jgi:hypothetical protein
MHITEQAGGSEDPDSLILKNHDEFYGVQKISINYTSSRELHDHTTTVVNSYFSTMVADLLNDPKPKTMAECKQRSDWIKWKEAIETELYSLRKKRYSVKQYLHLLGPILSGSSGFSSGNGMRTMRL